MSKVFVVQRAAFKRGGEWYDKYDLSAAEEHGNIVYLLPPGNVAHDLSEVMARLEHRLSEWKSGDHLLALGDPVAIAAATMVASKHSGGQISLLKWDRHTSSYLPYVITIEA